MLGDALTATAASGALWGKEVGSRVLRRDEIHIALECRLFG